MSHAMYVNESCHECDTLMCVSIWSEPLIRDVHHIFAPNTGLDTHDIINMKTSRHERDTLSRYSASHSFVTEYHIFVPKTVLTHTTLQIWMRPVTNQTLSVLVYSKPRIDWFWLLGWLIHKGATWTRIAPLWIYTSNGTAWSLIWRSQVNRQKAYGHHEHLN